MNNNFKKSKVGEAKKVRSAFPQVCKWFDPQAEKNNPKQTGQEVEKRFQRLQESGTSPCEGCPLCEGHH